MDVVDGADVEVGAVGNLEGMVGVRPGVVEVAAGSGDDGAEVVQVGGRQRRIADAGNVCGERV